MMHEAYIYTLNEENRIFYNVLENFSFAAIWCKFISFLLDNCERFTSDIWQFYHYLGLI